ncbi:hypothetical protein GF356_13090 [candidate division GN15 bacterium]|nr:hypothetical protein [candidate division GN15 bacterium]
MSTTQAGNAKRSVFVRYHLPFIVYAVLVLGVSSLPNLKSPDTGGLPFDKVAHVVEYAVFALLASRSMRRWVTYRLLLWVFSLTVVFALIDEFHQKFIPGREFDPLDYVANVAGALLGLVLVLIIRRRRRGATT